MSNLIRKKRFWFLMFLVGAGAFGGLAATGRLSLRAASTSSKSETAASEQKHKKKDPIVVTVAPLVQRPVQRSVTIVGSLQGYDEIQISPLVDGRIAHIRHDQGDVVRPGEPLLEIDDTDYRMAVEENERALELELAKLGLKDLPPENFDVNELPSVVRAKLTENNMSAVLERIRALARQKVNSLDDFEKADTNFRVAQADTRQRILDARQQLATVKHKQALLETSRKKLKDTKVLVPSLPGVAALDAQGVRQVSGSGEEVSPPVEMRLSVADRFVNEGEVVKASPPTKLFRLVVKNPLKLMAAVPERHVGRLKLRQNVELAVEAYPGTTFTGVVTRISPAVDRASRTFQIQVIVPNSDRRLLPGCFATGRVITGEDAAVSMIPESAVVKFAGVTKVFVVNGDSVQGVPIELGTRHEEKQGTLVVPFVEVIGEVPLDARVVTTGHSQLANGTQVRIRE